MNRVIVVMQMLPAIVTAIKLIEEAIPGEGQGEKKLAAVREMLTVVDSSIKDLMLQIVSVISVLVNLFNDADVFKKYKVRIRKPLNPVKGSGVFFYNTLLLTQ